MKHFKKTSTLYVYQDDHKELKKEFENTHANIYEGFYGRNIFMHIKKLLTIIDTHNIDIIQTQFTMGETLGYLIKLFRPNVKFVVAFVGPFEPKGFKKSLTQFFYKKVDNFVFISDYIKNEKMKQFPILNLKNTNIIYNGTHQRIETDDKIIDMKEISLFSISGLVDWKNIDVLIEAVNLLVNKQNLKNINLYVAGDGPERNNLEIKIKKYLLQNNVYLLGYQKNIGKLLNTCDIYVHPAYAEGFGIAIAEAMIAEKPIIVSNKGALPELIINNESGFVVQYDDANAWAEKIKFLISNESTRNTFGKNAKNRADKLFSVEEYIKNYEDLYKKLMNKK